MISMHTGRRAAAIVLVYASLLALHVASAAAQTCGNGTTEPGEQCDLGFLNGAATSCCTSECNFRTAGQQCRPSSGECDVSETCPAGGDGTCPANAKQPAGTSCTGDGNPCSLDQCNGVSDACQHTDFNPFAICRPATGPCDPPEMCPTSSTTCPPDSLEPSTTVCRSAVNECDADENCSGSSGACPADLKDAAGTSCSSDGNPCTLDQCDGASNGCGHPAGNAGATCRASAGVCDAAEICTGASTTCPADAFASSATECRGAAGECDLPENCTGTTVPCPADAKEPSGTSCTTDGNPCSLDQCDGASDGCQHAAGNAGAVCRPSAGECDLAENCTGTTVPCPADAKAPSGTSCTTDGNACSLDQCDGASDDCQHAAGNAGAVCRPSAGECDGEEVCDGMGTACPADVASPGGPNCPPSASRPAPPTSPLSSAAAAVMLLGLAYRALRRRSQQG